MTIAPEIEQLPLIDFAGFADGTLAAKQAIAQQVFQACHRVGFFYARNLGMAPSLIQQAFAQSQTFFALPLATKNQVSWQHEASNRGYVGLGRERLNPSQPGDLKEAFNIRAGRSEPASSSLAATAELNLWPSEPSGFPATMREFYAACAQAVEPLFEACAIALQLPTDFFVARHQTQDYTLRLLHYPPLASQKDRPAIRAGEHSDYGSLTLLFQHEVSGLEVQTAPGHWLPVPPQPDTIVVNVGDLLQRWTNDVFTSAVHRVRLPEQAEPPRSRYSIAFFCQPDFAVEVACLASCQSRDRPPRYAAVQSGEYLLSRLRSTY